MLLMRVVMSIHVCKVKGCMQLQWGNLFMGLPAKCVWWGGIKGP